MICVVRMYFSFEINEKKTYLIYTFDLSLHNDQRNIEKRITS